MKKTLLFSMAIFATVAAFAQNDPLSLSNGRIKAIRNVETISAHNYTVTGTDFAVITAARKDSINLVRANYSAPKVLKFICTNSSNDSTLIIPDAGLINGAASYWFNGTYKALDLYFDGTNYFILNKQ